MRLIVLNDLRNALQLRAGEDQRRTEGYDEKENGAQERVIVVALTGCLLECFFESRIVHVREELEIRLRAFGAAILELGHQMAAVST